MTSHRVEHAGSISAETLDHAVTEGILTAEQARMLRHVEQTRADPAPAEEPFSEPFPLDDADDEKFRFISGFSDIFVTIGLALFLGAIGYFSFSGIAVAIAAWLLSEYFTRIRRMALPSIALLLAFTVSLFVGMAELFDALVAAVATVAATAIYYQRFRVPVTVAAVLGALVLSLVEVLESVAPPGVFRQLLPPLLLICGLVIFALAMHFDLSDPQRQTRRTDIAFWLHTLAAPLIVHPLIGGLVGGDVLDITSALATLAIFLALALVALIVDRRAILVAGLGYAGFAFWSLFTNTGFSSSVVPLTMLALGTLVLLLSASWHTLRGALLALLPVALVRRLPTHT